MASDEKDADFVPKMPPMGKPIFYGSLEVQEMQRQVIARTQREMQEEDTGAGGGDGSGDGGGEEDMEDDMERERTADGGKPGAEEEGGRDVAMGDVGGEEEEEERDDEDEDDEEEDDEAAAAERRFELSEASRKAKEQQEKVLAELEMKRRARALAVPTNDVEVRRRLRAIGEPITLFGEREMERRERLRAIMARMDAAGQLDQLYAAVDSLADAVGDSAPAPAGQEVSAVPGEAELFYTEGTEELLAARRAIAQFSLPRASVRLRHAKRRREDPDEDEEAEAVAVIAAVANHLSMDCSEIGDERPLSGCAFSPDASLLATSGWSGNARLWSVPGVKPLALLRGHTERVTSVAFSPLSGTPALSATSANIVTGSADKSALLWAIPSQSPEAEGNGEMGEDPAQGAGPRTLPSRAGQAVGTPLQKLSGHLDRLARVAFHPSGRFVGTACFDKTWRLWDVETGVELLLQEGHSRAVYGIGFQRDGALVATCGLDSLARVWDLRTGRSILALEGHVKPLLCCEFAPNGHQLATAGEDNTCRIWDLRRRAARKACLYTVPAHSGLISQVRWEPSSGHFLVTTGYDNAVKIWSGVDFKPVRMLAGHEGKVMGADVSDEGQYVATVSYDRTIKLWAQGAP